MIFLLLVAKSWSLVCIPNRITVVLKLHLQYLYLAYCDSSIVIFLLLFSLIETTAFLYVWHYFINACDVAVACLTNVCCCLKPVQR